MADGITLPPEQRMAMLREWLGGKTMADLDEEAIRREVVVITTLFDYMRGEMNKAIEATQQECNEGGPDLLPEAERRAYHHGVLHGRCITATSFGFVHMCVEGALNRR